MENNAQRKKLYFAAQSGTGFIFYFSRRYSMNHHADFENICFCTLQDTCGGPDTELKMDLMNLTSYIILRTIYLCTFDTSKYIICNHYNHDHSTVPPARPSPILLYMGLNDILTNGSVTGEEALLSWYRKKTNEKYHLLFIILSTNL